MSYLWLRPLGYWHLQNVGHLQYMLVVAARLGTTRNVYRGRRREVFEMAGLYYVYHLLKWLYCILSFLLIEMAALHYCLLLVEMAVLHYASPID